MSRALSMLAFALVMTACQSPTLEMTGMIRCGSVDAGGAVCPDSFACRFGRCCPVGSTSAQCPLGVSDPTGALPCDNGACPTGNTCRFGRCCPTSSDMTCPMITLDPGGSVPCTMGGCPNGGECRFGQCCPASSGFDTCPAATNVTPMTYAPQGSHCPMTYVMRWGFCCPPNSDAATCPGTMVNQHDLTGQMYPPTTVNGTDNVCPQNYERRLVTYCCPSGADESCPPRVLGATCMNSSDCDAPPGTTAMCLTVLSAFLAFPHGYCASFGCDPSNADSCGPFGLCTRDMMTGTTSCTRRCSLDPGVFFAPCPGTNAVLSCYLTNGTDRSRGTCLPDCTNSENAGECVPPVATCNTDIHFCAEACGPAHPCSTLSQHCSDRIHGGFCTN